MAFYKGNTRIGAIFKGNKYIGEIYKGNTKIEEFGYDKTQTGTLPMTINGARKCTATFELSGNSSGVTGIFTRKNKHNIPLEYVELQYLNAQDGAYIDSGVPVTSTMRVDTKISIDELNHFNAICGSNYRASGSGTTTRQYTIYANYHNDTVTSNKARFYSGTEINKTGLSENVAGKAYEYVKDGKYNYIDDVPQNHNTVTFSGNGNTLYICAVHKYDDTYSGGLKGNMYYFMITKDGVRLKEYYPVIRISDNRVGFYDMVSGYFYSSDGPTEFVAGPSNVEYGESIIVTSNCTQHLTTIVAPRPLNKIGDKADVLTSTYALYNIGIIESYNGETITTEWRSSTGSLSQGAYVIYVLSLPQVIQLPTQTITLYGDNDTDIISLSGDISPSAFKVNYKSKLN